MFHAMVVYKIPKVNHLTYPIQSGLLIIIALFLYASSRFLWNKVNGHKERCFIRLFFWEFGIVVES